MTNARWFTLTRLLAIPFLVLGLAGCGLGVFFVLADLPPHEENTFDGLGFAIGILLLVVAVPGSLLAAATIAGRGTRLTGVCGLVLALAAVVPFLVSGEPAMLVWCVPGLALGVVSVGTLATRHDRAAAASW
jgi:hypothetical protein